MNKNYNLKLDLQFRCNNQTMKFNQFDNNTSDFFMKINSFEKIFKKINDIFMPILSKKYIKNKLSYCILKKIWYTINRNQ